MTRICTYRQEIHAKITRNIFYSLGGFSNPKLYRKMLDESWAYFEVY